MLTTLMPLLLATLLGVVGQLVLKYAMSQMGALQLSAGGVPMLIWRMATSPYVIGVLLFEIADDRRQDFRPVDGAALAQPVEEAEPALAQKLDRTGRRQWREMRVGEMGQQEHQELPINIPARKTSAPPTMT